MIFSLLGCTNPQAVRDDILKMLQQNPRYTRLDVAVEYPFGRQRGPVVTLAGCVDRPEDAHAARFAIYRLGVLAVFDASTILTSADKDIAASVCNSAWLHDGRSVFEFMALPDAPRTTDAAQLELITDISHRERVRLAVEGLRDLEAQGVSRLAMALREIHSDIMLWKHGVYPPEDLIPYLQTKLEVWARMEHQDVRGESLTTAEWRARQKAIQPQQQRASDWIKVPQ